MASAERPLRVILGGTFDPIHRGHLQYAHAAAESLKSTVRLMPAADPVHRATPGARLSHRWRMIELATESHPQLIADDTELRLGPPTYSARTLRHLRTEFPDQIPVLLLGSDAFDGLPYWRDYPEVLDLGHFVFVRRPGHQSRPHDPAFAAQVSRRLATCASDLRTSDGGLILELELELIEASATSVREAVANGQALSAWLTKAVADYVVRHQLYQDPTDGLPADERQTADGSDGGTMAAPQQQQMVKNDLNQAQNASPTPDLQPEEVLNLVTSALDDGKADDIATIDVRGRTAITDFMVIASGNSTRHVKSLADAVHIKSKKSGIDVLGVEGGSDAEWVLVDVGDVLVHVMLPRTRAFYALEKLWAVDGESTDADDATNADASEG